MIRIPAGVSMRRAADGLVRRHETGLLTKARRLVDNGRPVDEIWRFKWVGKIYHVDQHLCETLEA